MIHVPKCSCLSCYWLMLLITDKSKSRESKVKADILVLSFGFLSHLLGCRTLNEELSIFLCSAFSVPRVYNSTQRKFEFYWTKCKHESVNSWRKTFMGILCGMFDNGKIACSLLHAHSYRSPCIFREACFYFIELYGIVHYILIVIRMWKDSIQIMFYLQPEG